jgi:hypothetical protein
MTSGIFVRGPGGLAAHGSLVHHCAGRVTASVDKRDFAELPHDPDDIQLLYALDTLLAAGRATDSVQAPLDR